MLKYPDLMTEDCTMEDYQKLEKYRDAYLAGKQEVDQDGNRIWCITSYLVFEHDEMGSLYEVSTAEGPTILCGRYLDGTAGLHVQDGHSDQRTDACAEAFVSKVEERLKELNHANLHNM